MTIYSAKGSRARNSLAGEIRDARRLLRKVKNPEAKKDFQKWLAILRNHARQLKPRQKGGMAGII